MYSRFKHLRVATQPCIIIRGLAPKVATVSGASCGLSIYFPVFGYSSGQFSDYTATHLSFAEERLWAQALEAYRTKATFLDTDLSVYTEGLTLVAANDDSSPLTGVSRLRIPVARGRSYYLRVALTGSFWHSGTPGSYGLFCRSR